MIRNIPNILTIIRIVLIPVIVVTFYIEGIFAHYITAGIFIFASITDYIDGILARRWKAQTEFGRILDPIADKMLVVATLVMMIDRKLAPVVPILAILCREIFVSGMREYLAEIKVALRVTFLAKIKTALQMIAIILIILGNEGSGTIYAFQLGIITLWIAAILTVITGYLYFHEGMRHIS